MRREAMPSLADLKSAFAKEEAELGRKPLDKEGRLSLTMYEYSRVSHLQIRDNITRPEAIAAVIAEREAGARINKKTCGRKAGGFWEQLLESDPFFARHSQGELTRIWRACMYIVRDQNISQDVALEMYKLKLTDKRAYIARRKLYRATAYARERKLRDPQEYQRILSEKGLL